MSNKNNNVKIDNNIARIKISGIRGSSVHEHRSKDISSIENEVTHKADHISGSSERNKLAQKSEKLKITAPSANSELNFGMKKHINLLESEAEIEKVHTKGSNVEAKMSAKNIEDLEMAFHNIFDLHIKYQGVKNVDLQQKYVVATKAYSDALSAYQLPLSSLNTRSYEDIESEAFRLFNEYKLEIETQNAVEYLHEEQEEIEVLSPSEYLIPENESGPGLETNQSSFVELQVTTTALDGPLPIYKAARVGMECYRKIVNAQLAVQQFNAAHNPLTIATVLDVNGAHSIYRLSSSGGDVLYEDVHPMNVWNKLAFYGSHRSIGQWSTDLDLIADHKIKLYVNFRDQLGAPTNANNLHVLGIKKEDSYVTTPYHGSGKPYGPLAGDVLAGHGVLGMNSVSYAIYDSMLSEDLAVGGGGANHITNGQNIRTEALLYSSNGLGGYRNGIVNDATAIDDLKNNIDGHIHNKVTVDGFINCYKLIVGTTINNGINADNSANVDINNSCNLRVFELFSAVVIAEVHRDSYTAVINAAMLDLFVTPREADASNYALDDFHAFFGNNVPGHVHKHNLAFSTATANINTIEAVPAWYRALQGNNIVINREKEVTRDWIKLLHNYECWLLTHQKVDGVNGGVNYNNADRAHVNLDNECINNVIAGQDGVWEENVWNGLRTSFKIYAAYQAAKHLNGWNHRDNGHDTDIGNKLSDNVDLATHGDGYDEAMGEGTNHAIYNEIVNCIHNAVGVDGGCVGDHHLGTYFMVRLPAANADNINSNSDENIQQEICIDILCGLLSTNYLDY